MIYFCYNFFDRAKETNIYENKIEDITFADINLFYFSSFIFKKKLLLHRRRKPSEKVVVVEEELRGIDIDDIANLEDSTFVHQWGTWESRSYYGWWCIHQEKRPNVLKSLIGVHCIDKCRRREYFFNNHVEYCEFTVFMQTLNVD